MLLVIASKIDKLKKELSKSFAMKGLGMAKQMVGMKYLAMVRIDNCSQIK